MNFFRLLAGLALCSSLSACAVAMSIPASRFVSPEATGKQFGGDASFGYGGASRFVLVPDTTATPPVTNDPAGDRSSAAYLQGDLGLLESLDLGLVLASNATGDTPSMLRLKYQFVGAPHLARQTGFSLATTVSGGLGSHTGSDNSFSGVTSTTEASQWAYDVALIAGYRGTGTFLIYGGPFATRAGSSGTIHQNKSGVVTDYAFAGAATQVGANIGFQHDPGSAFYKFEGTCVSMSPLSQSFATCYWGFELGLRWQ